MKKSTFAINWDVFSKDTTGAFLNLDYKCPYCDFDNSEIIFIGAGNVDKIDDDFETDRVCGYCLKDVIVVCR